VEPDEGVRRFRYLLQRLHRDRGEPSTHDIERWTGSEVSHTTVARALRDGEALPGWGKLSPIIEALGGDEEWFRQRWVAMKDNNQPGSSAWRSWLVIVTLLVPVLALLVSLREHHPLMSHLSLAQRGSTTGPAGNPTSRYPTPCGAAASASGS
jgi:hypothetical protein